MSTFAAQQGFMHYLYVRVPVSERTCSSVVTLLAQTFPAIAVAMFITSMWAWTDIEIKKMQVRPSLSHIYFPPLITCLQPYVDLTHGDAPPQRSLLLDYTRTK